MKLLILGFALGVLLACVASLAFVASKFRVLLAQRCQSCGRAPSVLAQIIDLETRRSRMHSILCEACAEHGMAIGRRMPPPWSRRGDS